MRTITVIAATLLVLGCRHRGDGPDSVNEGGRRAGGPEVVDQGEMLSRNGTGLAKLSLGMDKQRVLDAMGTFEAEANDGNIHNPFKTEAFTKGADTYEILYYWTTNPPPFVPIRDRDTTPVVLKNGKVAGWGWTTVSELRPQNP